jgi:nucleoside-diphosphate-sugar epimerase
MKGQPLPITGDGKMTRDFTYVTDIVDALLSAGIVEQAIGAEMNIASAREIEIVQMAEMVNELTGNKAGLLYTDRRKWDTKSRLLASIDKARDLLDYDPKTTFEDGLRTTIKWFENNWDDICRDAEFPPGMSSAVKNYVLRQDSQKK